jgi:tRNA(Ile)-lysidine synthase
LLLAHHEDDQAETIMMRLANGQGVKGLQGIKNPAGIPECYGIHGVHESGGCNTTPGRDIDQRKKASASRAFISQSDSYVGNQLPVETGGIQVYRPFLGFSKARLVATCLTENMKWFEDHTNQDPTATMRNAIRYIYSKHSMPASLTKSALLALSTRVNDKAAGRIKIMKSWLARCRITRFETRAGTIRVRFGDLNQFRISRNVWPPENAGQIAAELLRQIILLVSPQEHIDLTSLRSAIRYIFPELYQQAKDPLHETAFTACGVYFQPFQKSNSQNQSATSTIRKAEDGQKSEWFISRQPYVSGSLSKLRLDVPATKGSWSPWHLYDGRYWIRVQNLSTISLLIEPFKREQMAGFRASLEKPDRRRFRRLLREKTPGHVRWTLPAIVRRDEDGEEKVVALPSLDIGIPGLGSLLRWELKYKKIYTADLPMDESLLGSSR